MKLLLWLIPLSICMFVQAHTTRTEPLLQNEPLVHIQNYPHQWDTQNERVKKLVADVLPELKSNNNIRPTTEYTMLDIIFFLKRYLPSWVYPSSVWKQDPITRRRNIARTVRSSPLAARPRYVALRNEMIEWTKTCNQKYYNQYAVDSNDRLETLIDSMLDFVDVPADEELMNPDFLTAGFDALNKAVHDYIKDNNRKFSMVTKEANDQFNTIATLAGELRIPLESIREDAIIQTKYIRDELFDKVVHGLHHLIYTIQTNVGILAHELIDADETTAEALRKHTTNITHSELLYFEKIETETLRLKSIIAQIWENATNELAQSPFTTGYWIDVTAEVKEAFAELAKLIAVALRKLNKQNKCPCRLKL